MKTRITELLGIKYPIFLGGMAWISDGKLAAAVSNGGGLGIIAARDQDAEGVREQIRIARELTDRPFGVNLILISPYKEEVAKMLLEERVAVITTGAGSPKAYLPAWVDAGIKVIPVIANATQAEKMTRLGASAIVAEGSEAGGHIGEMNTMAMIPQVCDATDLPVIAAGGIADGRQAAAAFMLGAEGIQVGTRFLLATECSIHRVYKNYIIQAKDTDTVTAGRRLGHPVRALNTALPLDMLQAEYNPKVSNETLEKMGSNSLRKAVMDGDIQGGSFLAGQVAGMVKKEQPAAEIIQEIFDEMQTVLQNAQRLMR